MTDSEKLKIALEALLELSEALLKLPLKVETDAYDIHQVRQIAQDALREIRREHCLDTFSSVVAETLAGVRV